MHLDQLRRMIGRTPHAARTRRAMHLKVLGRLAKRDPDFALRFAELLRETCVHYGIGVDDVLGWSKNHHSIAPARRLLWVFLHESGIGFNVAAALLGARNHSTAIRAVREYYRRRRYMEAQHAGDQLPQARASAASD